MSEWLAMPKRLQTDAVTKLVQGRRIEAPKLVADAFERYKGQDATDSEKLLIGRARGGDHY